MKIQMSTLLKPALLTLAIATAIPSSAIAFDPDYIPDEMVTMTVDLPATDGSGGGGDGVCSGYSSLETSATSLAGTLDEVNPGNSNPTLEQRVRLYGYELDDTFTDSNDGDIAIFTVDGDRLEINSDWAAANSATAALLDTNDDGFIDGDDYSPLMLDRRVFVSDPFNVSFDASTCIDSLKFGLVWAERAPVETFVEDPDDGYMYWKSAEIDFSQLFPIDSNDAPRVVATDENNASAYLLRPTAIAGGLINVPLQLANYGIGFGPPIPVVAGDEGSASLRGVMQLFGDQTQGQFRVKFGFWLEVDTFDNFLDDSPFWFGEGPP